MSLKAKIEAVIYASEEPVTLAQLVGLLGQEGQAELDALEANQPSLDLDLGPEAAQPATQDIPTPDDPEPDANADALNAEVFDTSETPEAAADAPAEAVLASAPEAPAEAAAEADPRAAKLASRKLRDYFRSLLEALIVDYTTSDRGLEIVEVAGGYRLRTKPEYHDAVRGFIRSLKPPLKLSLQALETLAVVAYKQPVTAPEISEIRGVESGGTLGSLMARKLVTTAGRKQVIGRPILYKTTKDFLLRFGLKDINELPSIEEFEKMAGELNETLQEEIPMEEHPSSPEDSNPDIPHHDGSPALDELNAVPPPTHILHQTPEDLEADDSTQPEGSQHEPPAEETTATEPLYPADGGE